MRVRAKRESPIETRLGTCYLELPVLSTAGPGRREGERLKRRGERVIEAKKEEVRT